MRLESSETVKFLKNTALAGLLGIVILQFSPVLNAAETADTIRGVRSPIPVILAGSSTVKNWGDTFARDEFSPVIITPRGVNGEVFRETVARIKSMSDICDARAVLVYSAVNDMSSNRVQNIAASDRFETLKHSQEELTEFIRVKCNGQTELLISESPQTRTVNDSKAETGWLRNKWNAFLEVNSGKGYRFQKLCDQSLNPADWLHILRVAMQSMGNKLRAYLLWNAKPEVCP